MTQEQNVVGEVSTGSSVNPTVTEAITQNNVAMEPVTEKMLPQSKVNEIVGATKKAAYDKAYQDAANKIESERSPSEPTKDIGSLVDEKIGQRLSKIESDQQEALAFQHAEKTMESLKIKVDAAASKYEDFVEATSDIPYNQFPSLLNAADTVDNAGDVLYHLGKNPTKFRELAGLFDPGNPLRPVAMKELKALSDSLKNNETAKQRDLPRGPLSQVRPSNVGVDNGKKSIKELRAKYTG